jgi:integrase
MPLHEDFAQWLAAQQRGIGLAHVFRSLANIGTGGSLGLSMQFRGLMQKAGIAEKITPADGAKGRTRSSKSFHSLRHYVVSELANQGVAVDVRKSLVGHSDSRSHAIYTHHDDLVRRDAIAKLPTIMRRPATP